jgi:hypothetical protein
MKKKPKTFLNNFIGALAVLICWALFSLVSHTILATPSEHPSEWNPQEIRIITAPPTAGKSEADDPEKAAIDDCPGEVFIVPHNYIGCHP